MLERVAREIQLERQLFSLTSNQYFYLARVGGMNKNELRAGSPPDLFERITYTESSAC